ncbi:MAG: 30S ribosomal protein S6, partial [Candidatus Paceibacterota bacterium]
SEDEVATHVSTIKSILDKASARVISEEYPTLIELAYTISKKVRGSKESFDSAYFGWIKFESSSETIEEIDEAVRPLEEVLRFIIVKTLREDTIIKKDAHLDPKEGDVPTDSDASIDNTIDELVIE